MSVTQMENITMMNFTYSADIAVMVAQSESADMTIAMAKRNKSVATLLAIASWKRANANMTQTEIAKALGLAQPAVSNAVKVLTHDDAMEVLKVQGKKAVQDDGSVVAIVEALVDNYGGKAVHGIYIEMYGKDDRFDLVKAVETLLASAAKRDIAYADVLAEVIHQIESKGE